jgi:hypothetical protein
VRSLRLVATIAAGVTLMFAINVGTAGAQVAFTWSPESLAFGKQKVGKKSEAKAVTVVAHCGPDIDIDPGPGFIPAPGPCSSADIAISGQFVISSMTCPQTGFVGENGASCAINVRFKPQSKGKKKGFLRISSNPFGGVPLAGKGCKKENGKLDCKK